jgi:HK97 family phage portal protein
MNRFTLSLNALIGNYKAIANMLPTWQEGTATYTEVNFENMVRHGWRKNELIFACISKTANTAASVKLQVKSKSSDKEIKDHPLRQLLIQPNPFMSEFDLWASIIIYQKLAGCAYFEKERTRGGQIIHLWPLRPDWIHPIMSSSKVIAGYSYEVPGLQAQTLKAEDVLDFKMFDPLNAYTGYPPVAVAARVGDVDNAVTDYLKLFFEKGGTPPGILTTTQKLVDSEVANIRRRWAERYGGIDGWLQPAVLDSDASYQQIGSSFKDMGFQVLDARNEARICMVLDVPPIIVGAKVGLDSGTYSNYEQARRSWWEDSLIPQYVHVNNEILVDLVPEFGEGIFTAWDYSEVPALRSDDTSKWDTAIRAFQVGSITLNQFYERIGLDKVGTNGDVYLRPSGVTPVTIADFGEKLEPIPVVVNNNTEQPEVEDEEKPIDENGKSLPLPAQYKNAPDDDVRRKKEKQMQKQLEGYFSEQLQRVKVELG